ncbi:hypothetical protein NHX12_030453 [Muraenolepis orangiensis]|uniref:Uncharacterized protein n=1 Tax=Muraenolepis orangiensis TaxID=630683 RepID=A0A9Q0E872_9TELE|nr:hypothetical protein NHX12_030453 [Muraenolepis orangiensis]
MAAWLEVTAGVKTQTEEHKKKASIGSDRKKCLFYVTPPTRNPLPTTPTAFTLRIKRHLEERQATDPGPPRCSPPGRQGGGASWRTRCSVRD